MTTAYLMKYPLHLALAQSAPGKPARGWDINDPQFRHRAVMALFPQTDEERPRQEFGVLFRLDVLAGQPPFFLIQSQVRPAVVPEGAQLKQIELQAPPTGTPVRFRIAINAIRRSKASASAPGAPARSAGTVPVPFDSDDEAPAEWSRMTPWLSGKFGDALGSIELINHQREVLGADRRGRRTSDRTVQVDTVDGVAIVGNSAELERQLINGVGRAKSYGCGLLSIQALA